MRLVSKESDLRSLLVGLPLSVAFVLLRAKQVDLCESWQVLLQTNFRLMLTPTVLTLGILSLRPWLRGAANNFFPARAGDMLRDAYRSRVSTLIGASLVLATVGLEKLLEALVKKASGSSLVCTNADNLTFWRFRLL